MCFRVLSQEAGSDSYSDERCPSVSFTRTTSSPPTPVAPMAVANGGSNVLFSPLLVHNDHLYHGHHHEGQSKQYFNQHRGNSRNETNNIDPRLFARFNFQEFKFVSAAYALAPQKAILPGLPEYGFRNEVKTTQDVLQEWRFGYKGRPAIQDLNAIYPSRWWEDHVREEYENRWMVVWEFVRLCREKNLTSQEAVEVLEELRGDTGSLRKLVDAIRAQHFYGLTTTIRIEQAGLSTMVAGDPDKAHSELVLQCDRTDFGRWDDRADSRLYSRPPEWETDHHQVEYESNQYHQDDNSRSGFGLRSFTPVLETNVLLPNQHDEAIDEPRRRPRIQKRRPVYRLDSDTEEESDPGRKIKLKKSRRSNKMEWEERDISKDLVEFFKVDPFPLPVRMNLTISDIWKEWTVGWEGEPSMESLVTIHGRSWVLFKRHHNHFAYRNRIVRVIHAGLRVGSVASEEEACAEIEKLRDTPDCTPFKLTLKREFKMLASRWGADKVCLEDVPRQYKHLRGRTT